MGRHLIAPYTRIVAGKPLAGFKTLNTRQRLKQSKKAGKSPKRRK
jgi:hypothetical protein